MTHHEAVNLAVVLRQYLPVVNDAQGKLVVQMLVPLEYALGEKLIPRFAMATHTEDFSIAKLRDFLRTGSNASALRTSDYLERQQQAMDEAAKTWPSLTAWWDALDPAFRQQLYDVTLEQIPKTLRRGYTPEIARTRKTFLARAKVIWGEYQAAV